MREAVIVDAVRTPGGKRNGKLKDWHPVDLASEVLGSLAERNSLDTEIVDDVIMGCVMQTGEQAYNVSRNAVLGAGWPEIVPGTTIDRQCGSSQQAAHFAAQGVIAGAYDVVVASGVESMSRIPIGVTAQQGPGMPFGPRMVARYQDGLVPQGISAEMIAEKWGMTREELDGYAVESHLRADRATTEGRFENEILPIEVKDDDGRVEMMTRDEGIRATTSMEALSKLPPVFKEDGMITAGNSSQITDGAAAILIMEANKAKELGYTPRARFHSFALAGADPVLMLTAPIPATHKVLAKAGLGIDDIDLFEVNEAFASVIGAWLRETAADYNKVNVNGGAIALGHPLGASGAKLMTTLLNELERSGGRFGLQTMCEGGGLSNATIIERLG
ncbi:MAG: thiolase family protein [Acidimicrobiia bacterium]|nr:thiolase family protein [Acidimicrobiia bacterium]